MHPLVIIDISDRASSERRGQQLSDLIIQTILSKEFLRTVNMNTQRVNYNI